MSADDPAAPTGADAFELYDLRVEVVAPPGGRILCNAKPGDWFEVRGELLHFPPGQAFSMYSLAAVLPLLPAKQRPTDRNDWMTSDAEVACPDPNCSTRLRITRLGRRTFRHADTSAVPLPVGIPRATLAPGYEISRLIKGGWQLAGGHGAIDPEQAVHDMARFVEAGITTFDCADIYTGAEELIGRFRKRYPELARGVRVHTKFVPDLGALATVDRAYVERIIDRSLSRLGLECLDLVQFHWWDYAVPRHVEIALELARLQQAGKIRLVGATNFDVPRLKEMVDAGVKIAAHQVQYSVLDDRPEHGMVEFCAKHGIGLLCFGTVAGGFLSERWIGKPEPTDLSYNRSLVKYKLIVDEYGGWQQFQDLLRTLATIGSKHGCDVATVATRWILDRPGVAAAIVGATNASHVDSHAKIGALVLDAADRAALEGMLAKRRGPAGDVYTLERDRNGPHGRIMKYDLNK